MTEQFDAAVTALSQRLGIALTATEGMASLTLDGTHTIHLAALGDSQIAMSIRLSPLRGA
ncbi:MAG: hypothetical protein ACRCR1_02145 [Aeromonas sp.]